MSARAPQQPSTPELLKERAGAPPRPPAGGAGPGSGIVLHPRRARLVFAIVGLAVVIAIIAAIIVFAGGRAAPVSATKRLPATLGGTTSKRYPVRTQAAPGGGGLASLIKRRVGPYSLRSAKPSGDLTGAGAADAYDLKYVRPGGATIYHSVAAFRTAGAAASFRAGIAGNLRKKYRRLLTQRFSGGIILVVFQVDRGVHALVWNDSVVYADAVGPQSDMPGFFRRLPY